MVDWRVSAEAMVVGRMRGSCRGTLRYIYAVPGNDSSIGDSSGTLMDDCSLSAAQVEMIEIAPEILGPGMTEAMTTSTTAAVLDLI